MQNETVRLLPPVQLFEQSEAKIPTGVLVKGQLNTPTVRIELPEEGGVLSWHVGDKYPVKGSAFEEAVYACDCIKRVVVNSMRFAISSPVRYFLPLFLVMPDFLQRKIVRSALEQFTNYTQVVFNSFSKLLPFRDNEGNEYGITSLYLKPERYCDMVREFRRVALPIAGEDSVNRVLVDFISMFWEFDDAYRYESQDIFGEINKEDMLKNPAKEMKRVLKIASERGGVNGLGLKAKLLLNVIPFVVRIRLVKEVLVRFFESADLKKLSLDEADFYRCLLWGGYRFRGIPDEERASIRIMIDSQWEYNRKRSEEKLK